jgi:hypothetical protein
MCLRAVAIELTGSSELLPEGMREEILDTLALLLPVGNKKVLSWYGKVCERTVSPLKMDGHAVKTRRLRSEQYEMQHYRRCRDRLVILKMEYDRACPARFRHAWRYHQDGERRNAFRMAVLAVILAFALGILQCMLSAWQIWIAYHSKKE